MRLKKAFQIMGEADEEPEENEQTGLFKKKKKKKPARQMKTGTGKSTYFKKGMPKYVEQLENATSWD